MMQKEPITSVKRKFTKIYICRLKFFEYKYQIRKKAFENDENVLFKKLKFLVRHTSKNLRKHSSGSRKLPKIILTIVLSFSVHIDSFFSSHMDANFFFFKNVENDVKMTKKSEKLKFNLKFFWPR